MAATAQAVPDANTSASKENTLQSNVLDIIQCAVCLGSPIAPKLLPCQHSFCLTCLEKTQRTRRGVARDLQCPTCRQTTETPIGQLPNCYKTIQLTELMRTTPAKVPVPELTAPAKDSPPSGLQEESISKLAEFLYNIIEKDDQLAQNFLEKLTPYDRKRIVEHHSGGYANAVIHAVYLPNSPLAAYMVKTCQVNTTIFYEVAKSTKSTKESIIRKMTLLHIAVQKNMPPLVKEIVNIGCDINAQSDVGATALMMASNVCNPEIFYFLLEHGADVKISRKNGLTCLMELAKVQTTAVVDPLPQMIQTIIQYGADVDAKDASERTALMHCAQRGTTESLRMLTAHGGNVYQKDRSGNTPLHYAVMDTRDGVGKAKILLETNADPYARNFVHEDGFLSAARIKNWPVFDVLMEHHKTKFKIPDRKPSA